MPDVHTKTSGFCEVPDGVYYGFHDSIQPAGTSGAISERERERTRERITEQRREREIEREKRRERGRGERDPVGRER